jgi:hypothetical protein
MLYLIVQVIFTDWGSNLCAPLTKARLSEKSLSQPNLVPAVGHFHFCSSTNGAFLHVTETSSWPRQSWLLNILLLTEFGWIQRWGLVLAALHRGKALCKGRIWLCSGNVILSDFFCPQHRDLGVQKMNQAEENYLETRVLCFFVELFALFSRLLFRDLNRPTNFQFQIKIA